MSRFEFLTAGESHGPALTTIVRGVPAGLVLDREAMQSDLTRRQHGYGRGGRMKIETDSIEILSGVRGGETLGSPITLQIRNRDFENWREAMDPWDVVEEQAQRRRVHAPRPGHADLAGGIKYDRRDLRDILERASARETAARVAAGTIARALLRLFGVSIGSGVLAIGAAGNPARPIDWETILSVDEESPARAAFSDDEAAMIAEIDRAKEAGETLGGVIAVVAHGVPVGLGSYTSWDEKLDGRIAQAILSIHAVKGVAIGDGIAAATRQGSTVHDPIRWDESEGYSRVSNNAGGLEGGVTNGEDVVVRVFMKPISTLRRGLPSVDIETREEHRSQWERSDVTAVAACGVVAEAMLAIVLADAFLRKFGGDSVREMKRSFDAWTEHVRTW